MLILIVLNHSKSSSAAIRNRSQKIDEMYDSFYSGISIVRAFWMSTMAVSRSNIHPRNPDKER